ncbi:MAG: hypothetical protein KJ697_01275 [Nanoarchaeota archaeon]|nr:hypothetical protein [Nanoarchaeota archaeon]
MNKEKKSMLGYIICGILAGVSSYYINNIIASFVVMIVVLYVGHIALKKLFKIHEKFKWFLSNGGWIYVFIWFISWTILLNVI